jgi:hypothetical protein
MHSELSADFLGKMNGFDTVAARTAVNGSGREATLPSTRNLLSRDNPFAITTMIGGTNLRVCVSHEGSEEPLKEGGSIKWQELNAQLAPRLKELQIDFGDAHHIAMPVIAKHYVDFIASQFDPEEGAPPFDKVTSCNFSVAGVVRGEGLDATVSTTNTGLRLTNDKIALTLLSAIQNELAAREWPAIPQKNISVVNDAAAATYGQVYLGGLQGVKNGLFVIIGTGVGSMGWSDGKLNHNFDELGHRIIFDTHKKQSILLGGAELNEKIDTDGSFKNLPVHQRYAENVLAGPWAAISFVKSLEVKPEVMSALAERIAPTLKKLNPSVEKSLEEIEAELYELADLQFKNRTRWAVSSNSHLVRAVNDFLMTPNPDKIFEYLPCDFSITDVTSHDPDKALVLLGFAAWKNYFKNVGLFIGRAYNGMHESCQTAEKIVIGGGIGEAANRFPPLLRQVSLGLIHQFAKIPDGIVDFTRISAEAAECALSYKSVVDTKVAQGSSRNGLGSSIELAH